MRKWLIEMVTASVDAFVKKDVELAQKVIEQDDIVDDYFSRVKCGIITLIAENHADGEFALDLLMISKYFERIGDHATNIAEWVIYSVTGTHSVLALACPLEAFCRDGIRHLRIAMPDVGCQRGVSLVLAQKHGFRQYLKVLLRISRLQGMVCAFREIQRDPKPAAGFFLIPIPSAQKNTNAVMK